MVTTVGRLGPRPLEAGVSSLREDPAIRILLKSRVVTRVGYSQESSLGLASIITNGPVAQLDRECDF